MPRSSAEFEPTQPQPVELSLTGPSSAAPLTASPEPELAEDDSPAFQLSLTQIIASAAAATTAALLGSRLGVAGTILGAALASLISVVAGAVYSHSIAAARHRVKVALHRELTTASAATGELSTQRIPVDTEQLPIVARSAGMTPIVTPQRRAGRPMLLGAAATVSVFAVALLFVTGIETVRGQPLSGGESGGLSVFGGQPGGVASADEPDQDNDQTSTVTIPGLSANPALPATVEPAASDEVESSAGADPTSETARATAKPTSATSSTQGTPTSSSPVSSSAESTTETTDPVTDQNETTSPSAETTTAPATSAPASEPANPPTVETPVTDPSTDPAGSVEEPVEPTQPTDPVSPPVSSPAGSQTPEGSGSGSAVPTG